MMLENCCYDFFELATLNMARQGLLGEIIHTEGAYIHDLRGSKFKGYYKHWRLEYSKYHTGNPYPTHGLGPVAQILGFNQEAFVCLHQPVRAGTLGKRKPDR